MQNGNGTTENETDDNGFESSSRDERENEHERENETDDNGFESPAARDEPMDEAPQQPRERRNAERAPRGRPNVVTAQAAAARYAEDENFANVFEAELVSIRDQLEQKLEEDTRATRARIAAIDARMRAADPSTGPTVHAAAPHAKVLGRPKMPRKPKAAARKPAARKPAVPAAAPAPAATTARVKPAAVPARAKPAAATPAHPPGEDLQAQSARALQLIREAGKEGIGTLALSKQLGTRPGAVVAPLLKSKKVKSRGARRGTTYFATA